MQLDSLLRLMVRRAASDLFVTAGVPPSMRLQGRIRPVMRAPLSPDHAREMAMSVMGPREQEHFEASRECNFALHRTDIGRFRINVFQSQGHVGMVIRRIETRIPTVDELALPPRVAELAMAERGLVLFVGATGAGKSTTLAAAVGHRNGQGHGHIVAIEDPVEYIHRPRGCIVTQREVGIDTDSFEVALRNTLRQAPDVAVVGELRSRETAEHAMAFADTGHLCLTTLHAGDAVQAVERLVHLFPRERRDQVLMDLSLNLKAVVAQRLVPTADGNNRVPAVEMLLNTPLVAERIQRGELDTLRELMKRGAAEGMQTFDHAVYELYRTGIASYQEALRCASSANEVRLMIKLSGDEAGGVAEPHGPSLSLSKTEDPVPPPDKTN